MPNPSPRPPVIRKFTLPHLTDAAGDDLGVDDEREAERFVDVDLTGRDLMGIRFGECELENVTLHEADLRGARMIETLITRTNSPILSAPRSTWRDVVIDQSRVGSGELFESDWRSVRISHSKLGYLNFRSAELLDVEFVDCTIDELDLGGAKATRVAFTNTSIRSLDVARATLLDFDLRDAEFSSIRGVDGLRGATITELQLAELAPIIAGHLGIQLS
jgi:hypothetical protein